METVLDGDALHSFHFRFPLPAAMGLVLRFRLLSAGPFPGKQPLRRLGELHHPVHTTRHAQPPDGGAAKHSGHAIDRLSVHAASHVLRGVLK